MPGRLSPDGEGVPCVSEVTFDSPKKGRRHIVKSELTLTPARPRPTGCTPPLSTSTWCATSDEDSSSSFRSDSVPSDTGLDSGVSSEHDTPPPQTRPLPVLLTPSPSDSDNESSTSSVPSSASPDLSPDTSSPTLPRPIAPLHLTVPRHPPRIPNALLRQIKERSKEFRRRRQRPKDTCASATVRGGRPLHRRSSRMMTSSSEDETTSLTSLTSSSCCSASSPASSTMSLPLTDEDLLFTSSSSLALFEHPDQEAATGFAGIPDIFAPQQESTIRSSKGTVRGVKNRVRAGIATFTCDHRVLKQYAERERGKVVVYVSTLGIVRDTHERCLRARKILWTLLVHFDERDVFMSRDIQLQVLDRLRAKAVTVPHVFIEGQYLGGVEVLERLNEIGELRRIMLPYMRPASTTPCDSCGGFRLLPCTVCSGSKKSVHRNDFTLEFVALKCSACDESGLVQCVDCAID